MIIITWLQRRGERGNDGGKEEEGPRKITIMFVLKEGGRGGLLSLRGCREGPGGGARGGGITIIIFLQEGGGRRVSLLLLLHGC